MSDTYKGIIKKVPDSSSNIYSVRIPYLEDNTGKELLYDGIVSHEPGFKDEYNVDDVVIVTFEGSLRRNAIILGKLNTTESEEGASITAKSITVSGSAVLPEDTKIGNYSTHDLFILYNKPGSGGAGSQFTYEWEGTWQ